MNPRRPRVAAACLAPGMLLAACVDEPTLTSAQWDAIETREFYAPASTVLPAAAAVLLDQGYLFTMSDQTAGLVGAESMRRHPSEMELYARAGGFGAATWLGDSAVLWVRPLSASRSEMRMQIHSRGRHITQEQVVTEFWDRTKRRLLAAEPAKGG